MGYPTLPNLAAGAPIHHRVVGDPLGERIGLHTLTFPVAPAELDINNSLFIPQYMGRAVGSHPDSAIDAPDAMAGAFFKPFDKDNIQVRANYFVSATSRLALNFLEIPMRSRVYQDRWQGNIPTLDTGGVVNILPQEGGPYSENSIVVFNNGPGDIQADLGGSVISSAFVWSNIKSDGTFDLFVYNDLFRQYTLWFQIIPV